MTVDDEWWLLAAASVLGVFDDGLPNPVPRCPRDSEDVFHGFFG